MANLLDCARLLVQHTGRNDLIVNSDAIEFTDVLTNGDMEGVYTAGVAAGWTKDGTNITCAEETSNRVNGSKSQKITTITGSTANLDFYHTANLSMTKGKWYRLTFYIKMVSGTFSRVGLYDANAIMDAHIKAINATSTSWTQYTFDFQAKETGTTYRLIFTNQGPYAGVFYLDRVRFGEITGVPDARWYIRQACDFLDSQQENPQQTATHVEDISSGDFIIDLENCRAVNSVYIKQTGEDRVKLERATFEYVLENYTDRLTDSTSDTPSFFAIVDPRQVPAQFEDAVNATDAEWLISGLSEDTTRIVLMPPADGDYTVVVHGLFNSTTLTADDDTNWWTINKPWIVVWTAKFILEGSLRSADGMKDLMAFIQPYLTGIDKDLVELYMPDSMTMEG